MDADRREFLKMLGMLGLAVVAGPMLWNGREVWAAEASGAGEAGYWEKLPGGGVKCNLCPLGETLGAGQMGHCRTRENRGGRMELVGRGEPCVVNVDPIEKNPLGHVLPGRKVLSVAHAGCNVECLYCQNWEMALKSPRETKNVKFVESEALATAQSEKLAGVNFTYTEPVANLESCRDLAQAAHKAGMRAFACTNGYVNAEPMDEFVKTLDAVTVTLKGFSDGFYQKYVGAARVGPVLETCKRVKASGKWIEIATLVIPGVNDSPEELGKIAKWIGTNLGADTPWHLERFTPAYKLASLAPTPVKTLETARERALASGLRHVYLANVPLHEGNHTYCPKCKAVVIRRVGFKVLEDNLALGKCKFCGTAVAGIWS